MLSMVLLVFDDSRGERAAGVVRDVEGAWSEGGAETLSSRLLEDAWDVSPELDTLAAAYADERQ